MALESTRISSSNCSVILAGTLHCPLVQWQVTNEPRGPEPSLDNMRSQLNMPHRLVKLLVNGDDHASEQNVLGTTCDGGDQHSFGGDEFQTGRCAL